MASSETNEKVTVTISSEAVAKLDALLPELSTPTHQATRGDALRAVILKGLEIEEAQQRAKRSR